jgi:hypothetical protein
VLRGLDERHWPGIGTVLLEVQDLDDRLEEVRGLLADRGFSVAVEPAPLVYPEIRTYLVSAVRG